MPNGSIGPIDFRCGRGSVSLNYTVIRDFAKSWRDSLRLWAMTQTLPSQA